MKRILTKELIPTEVIEKRIYFIRGHNVMLDKDLAELYGIKTFNLNKAVFRNSKRFPSDFMFQLTLPEAKTLKFQIGMSKAEGRGGRRTLPYVFTEEGVSMLSSVLHSDRSIEVNIAIMRAFVKMRRMLSEHRKVMRKLQELEIKVGHHDRHIEAIFAAIRQLMTPRKPKVRIGFHNG